VYAAGVSLGGNAFAKWLGEQGDAARAVVARAVVVSAPVDLMAAGRALSRGLGRLYGWNFLRTLKPNALEKLERFPGIYDRERLCAARTLREFDDAVTAPLHGFAGVDDYYTRSAAKQFLLGVRVPTLLLNARDDPFLPAASLPTERECSAAVKLEFPARGGHVGFVTAPFPGHIEWLPQRILHFFEHSP
jgi:predicted alpha/beta-fold hydrolase